jgi:uncharacterized protein (TIGR03435 family)
MIQPGSNYCFPFLSNPAYPVLRETFLRKWIVENMIERFALNLDFRRGLLSATIVVVSIAASTAFGQAGTPPPPAPLNAATFDVASIRENVKSVDGRSHIYSHPENGQFMTINVSLRGLLQFAFDMPGVQIVNTPDWLGNRSFDVDAKADKPVDDWIHTLDSVHAREAKNQMVQALLADRFGLKTHRETRDLPAYVLVVAKGGPKLHEANGGSRFDEWRTQITDQGATMTTLADQIAKVLGRPVVDKTGIAGRFDVTLKWTPDGIAPQTDTDSASIFTAVQEQLGLKLESTKTSVPVLVIDHVEMPSAN